MWFKNVGIARKQKSLWILLVGLIVFVLTILVSGTNTSAATVPADNFHYTYDDDGSYTRDAAIPAESHQDAVGYDASARHNVNASDVGAYMQVDAVWSMYAHGNETLMAAFEGSERTYLTNDIIQGYDLSQLKVAVFYGCDTAQTPTSGISVTDAAVTAGAGAAIGFSEDVFISEGTTTGPAYVWSNHFWASMAKGNGIEEAAIYARDRFYDERKEYLGVNKYLVSGNTGQTIVPAGYK